MKALKMTKNALDRLLLVSSLIILVVMVLVILYQVFSRQILGTAPAWTEELSRLLFVWVSFFGIAYGFKEKLHIGVGLVVNMFPEKVQDIFDYLAKALVIAFGMILIYYGWQFTVLTSSSTMPAIGWPSSVLYACMPIAGVFVTLNGIELLFRKGMHQELDDVSEE
ncbi:TRAP-type C4-dicarboxylate transport system permease small subunit [Virgibacillus natechei]|uniref:TRAP-type C4-dicarboxylate transport system permease small subunit n=1 Tax=Virgibacillus natechei TaxID=1216297 RepID=A0ABS4ICC7_9BACI|nr:TRAP transporter small permease [Virgibacillus natechei]MBP1968590.1 TRAP-type C4-dicarboxylate transport system permease small subunit [Virgibacillus natechei]UZD13700.1 TRAP transporter small permease [Virgibacillus natechei]